MSKRNKITVKQSSAERKADRLALKEEKRREKLAYQAQIELEKQQKAEEKKAKKLARKKADKPAETTPISTDRPVEESPIEPNAADQAQEASDAEKTPDKRALKKQEKAARKQEKLSAKKAKKQAKRVKPASRETPLSPKEQRMREYRLRRRVYFAAWTIATLLIYFALIGLVAIGIYFSIWMTDSGVDNTTQTSMRVVALTEDGKTRRTVRTKQDNGTFYLPITLVDTYGEYIHAGDYKARTIQFIDSGENAIFSVNSPFCTINGVSLNMEKPVLLIDGELYLPIEFYQTYLTGVEFQKSGSGYEILSDSHELGYKLKPAAASVSVPEEEAGSLLEFATKVPEFVSDLSAYERYMNPGETTEFLTLVNAYHGIAETYRPDDLTGVEDQNAAYPGGDYHAKLRLSAAKSLDAMLQEARANGFDGLQATSGYRTYAEQNYRFNSMVSSLRAKGMGQAEAELQAMRTVHRPGYSEYQTGLAVDVRYPGESIDDFKDTAAASWLAENAYKFGFILRYPSNKESETGMDYQAWHFRYVGRYHAIRIKYLDMSLEEYIDFMSIETD